jgi:hypothetical protein
MMMMSPQPMYRPVLMFLSKRHTASVGIWAMHAFDLPQQQQALLEEPSHPKRVVAHGR